MKTVLLAMIRFYRKYISPARPLLPLYPDLLPVRDGSH